MFRFIIFMLVLCNGYSHAARFITDAEFTAPEAKQGLAVDNKYIYVVSDTSIAKYDKTTFEHVTTWYEQKGGPIEHLDSGVIVDGKLYCANSNYPEVPMVSSIEIWDAETMKHVGSHSFGIYRGSCTWIDRYDGFWWAAFAHYEKWKEKTGKGTEWTSVVKLDDSFREIQAWTFPDKVIERLKPMSNSGGSWGPDGFLYCTGHDSMEVYKMKIPARGSVLELVETLPIQIRGQGIAWDRTEPGILYGIRKKTRTVVKSRFR